MLLSRRQSHLGEICETARRAHAVDLEGCDVTGRASQPACGPLVTQGPTRLDAAANIGLLGLLWVGYTAVRALSSHTGEAALTNATRMLKIQSVLGLDIEQAVQSAITAPAVFVAANIYYLVHFPLTLSVVVLAFRRQRNSVFPVLRNSLIGSTAVALFVHVVVPMAPPRMLPNFVDATLAYGPNPYSVPGSGAVNQYAAMPSMHVGWAILTGYAIWKLANRPTSRAAAVLHPMLTAVVVIITGHHFISDALVGACLAVVFLALFSWRCRHRYEPPNLRVKRRTAMDRSHELHPDVAVERFELL